MREIQPIVTAKWDVKTGFFHWTIKILTQRSRSIFFYWIVLLNYWSVARVLAGSIQAFNCREVWVQKPRYKSLIFTWPSSAAQDKECKTCCEAFLKNKESCYQVSIETMVLVLHGLERNLSSLKVFRVGRFRFTSKQLITIMSECNENIVSKKMECICFCKPDSFSNLFSKMWEKLHIFQKAIKSRSGSFFRSKELKNYPNKKYWWKSRTPFI